MKILLPTLEQGYTLELANSVNRLGAEVGFYKFESSEFRLAKVVASIQSGAIAPDVIHLHWEHFYCYCSNDVKNFFTRRFRSLWLALDNLMQIRKLKQEGCKVVWTIHNSLSHDAKVPISEYLFRWGLSRLSDDIIVMSRYSQQEVSSDYMRRERIHIIPHGNFMDSCPNTMSREEARAILGIPDHRQVLLNFGLMRRYKGIDNLLHAFSRIEDPDVSLVLAGKCSDPTLKELILQAAQADDRIIPHVEFIPDKNIQIYMNAWDWVVAPVKKILNSGSVLLALSFGRPVIAPRQGGLPEIIEDGKSGFLYDKPNQLKEQLSKALLLGRSSWQKMTYEAFKVAQKYDWKDLGKQHLEVYQLKDNETH